MRGSVPRRVPDPSRKQEPRPVIQKSPQQIYEDCGEVVVPGNGEVKIYERRFVRPGYIEVPSINLNGLVGSAKVYVRATDGVDSVSTDYALTEGRNNLPAFPVEPDKRFSLWLFQTDGEDAMIDVDLAFVFQER